MSMSASFNSVSDLDRELADRLDATLDAETKYEREALEILAGLANPDAQSEPPTDIGADKGKREYAAQLKAAPDEAMTDANERAGVTLARVVFKDGDAFHFVGVPGDGEVGVVYLGSNTGRWLAATSDLPSPLRLYLSITQPNAPLPWLLAAIDKQKDRLALVEGRQLCDRIDDPLEANSETLWLRVPGLPGREPRPSGGDWLPDDAIFTVGGFCGWNGEQEFIDEVCSLQYVDPGPFGLIPNIIKCTSQLSFEKTHNTTLGGSWKRRKCATSRATACGSPVRIRHQYRKFGWSGWHWVTANDDIVGPAELTGSLWLGLVARRRRINYQRAGGFGGFRAWSGFSRTLLV